MSKLIWIIVLFMLILSGCGEKQEEISIIGTWVELDVSPDDPAIKTFVFSNSNAANSFFAYNWNSDTLTGTWRKTGDSLFLSYIQPKISSIDSIALVE